jgi:CubicO group peptidase (beta-lactamase class C family)
MIKKQLSLVLAIFFTVSGCVTDGTKEEVTATLSSSSKASTSHWAALDNISQKNEKWLSGTLFVRKGQRRFVRGFGFADEAEEIKNSEKTISLIASNAKNFTAAAILRQGETRHPQTVGRRGSLT